MTCPACGGVELATALNALPPPAGPVPAETLEFFERKGIKPGFHHQDVWPEEHLRSFTAAKFMRRDVLEAARQEVDRALGQGLTFHQFVRGELDPETGERRGGIEQRFREMGWWGRQQVVDPETGEPTEVDVPSRLKLIFDTNMRTARAAGQWQRIERRMDTHPYLLYLTGPSKRHRPQHLAWHGLLLPASDPWWQTHFPPNGYGCKCHVRQVSRREAARLERDGIKKPNPEPILGPDGTPTGHVKDERVPVRRERPRITYVDFRNKRTGEVRKVPKGVQPGFDRPPSSLSSPAEAPETGTQEGLDDLRTEIFERDEKPSRPLTKQEMGTLLVEAMESIGSDGGKRARRLGRAMVRGHFNAQLRTGSADKQHSDRVLFQNLGRGVLGSHGLSNGAMYVAKSSRRSLVAAAKNLRDGKPLSHAQEQVISTLVHETIHGFGVNSRSEVDAIIKHRAGRAIEETVTETLARRFMREALGADRHIPRGLEVASKRGGASYSGLLFRVRNVIRDIGDLHEIDGIAHETPQRQHATIQNMMEMASIELRKTEALLGKTDPPSLDQPSARHNGLVWGFVEALPLSGRPDQVRAARKRLYRQLVDERGFKGIV